MKIEEQEFTVQDLIEYEKRTCEPASELTFKLIGLSHYLDTESTWESETGETWSISRLIAEELAQPVIGAACGGTHRLMGFSYAVRKREQRGEPMVGEWLRARKYLDDYVDYTFQLQNEDGSFSTDWFAGRADSGDLDRRLQTSGHILEWLAYVLPQHELGDPRVVKAVDYLAGLLLEHRQRDWEIGPKGHALHALAIYDERVFGRKPGQRTFRVIPEELPEAVSAAVRTDSRSTAGLHSAPRVGGDAAASRGEIRPDPRTRPEPRPSTSDRPGPRRRALRR
jgi:hypothetical protein